MSDTTKTAAPAEDAEEKPKKGGRPAGKRRHRMSRTTRSDFITYLIIIAAYVIVEFMISGRMISYSMQGMLIPICSYIVMAVSLNVVVGLSGELSLGHAGFMSVGAFTGVIAAAACTDAIPDPTVRLIVAMVIGGLMAALAGFLIGIPVMRLQGDYLAIVTLAFGEIIKNLLNNLYVGLDDAGIHFSFSNVAGLHLAEGGRVVINGPQGAVGIQRLSTFTIGFVLVLVTVIVVLHLKNSRSGRAIMAVRDNRIATESVGINTTKYRMMAFVLSAGLAGMAGVLYGLNFSSIVPKKFDFNTSILILVYVVLGGMGNIRGSIISATILTVLPEALRVVNRYRMLLYAIVLILVMLVSNNETLKLAWTRFVGHFRRPAKAPEAAAEGGDVDER